MTTPTNPTFRRVAEYYERAKDAEGLKDALVAKLTEQRNFVLWWDAQEKDPGGGDNRRAPVADAQQVNK